MAITILQAVGALILGYFSASLINYLSDVLPRTRKLSVPICNECEKELNLVSSYLLLRRCPDGHRIYSIRHWLVQSAYPLILTALLYFSPPDLGFWFSALLAVYFGVVAVIDIEHRLILHPTTVFGVILGGAIGIYLHGLQMTLFGGVAGFAVMFTLYYIGKLYIVLIRKYRNIITDEIALGFGDVSLSTISGLILGWPGVIAGVFLAVMLGGAVAFIYIIVKAIARQYNPTMAMPYGPFLIAATIILLLR